MQIFFASPARPAADEVGHDLRDLLRLALELAAGWTTRGAAGQRQDEATSRARRIGAECMARNHGG